MPISTVDQQEVKARVVEILNRRPAVGLAVGVIRDGSLEFFHGHGVADVGSNTPITEDTVFRIASITKTFCIGKADSTRRLMPRCIPTAMT